MPVRSENTVTACDFRSDELAKEMLTNIIGEKNFDIDDIKWDDSKITVPEDIMADWQTKVDPVTIKELTERKIDGSGVFDAIMKSVHVHLKEEYDRNRITGAEYATTYTKLTEAALANAVQFCLQKNQAYFQGILAQAQAVTAGIQAQIAALTAKVQLAKVKAEALGVAAQYALTTMKLSTEDAQHALVCKQSLLAKYQAELMNPKPSAQDKDNDGDYTNIDYQNKKQQLADQTAQTAIRELQLQANQPTTPVDSGGNEIENGNIDFLIKEQQLNTQEAQADLYTQQKTAYQRKSELDVAQLYANQYTAMKSIDEGLAIPKALSGASINDVLQKLKVNVALGTDTTSINTFSAKATPNDTAREYSGIWIPDAEVNAEKAYRQYGVIHVDEEDNEEEEEEQQQGQESNP